MNSECARVARVEKVEVAGPEDGDVRLTEMTKEDMV